LDNLPMTAVIAFLNVPAERCGAASLDIPRLLGATAFSDMMAANS
jgi:hypothetical protein